MEVVHNPTRHRFEAGTSPNLAMLNYLPEAATVNMVHTEVPSPYQGQGLAGKLAKAALDWAREQGYKVVPSCSFVRGYIDKHPEYADLL